MIFWQRRRFHISSLRALVVILCVTLILWYSFNQEEVPKQPCSVPEEFTEKLHDLAYRYVKKVTLKM